MPECNGERKGFGLANKDDYLRINGRGVNYDWEIKRERERERGD